MSASKILSEFWGVSNAEHVRDTARLVSQHVDKRSYRDKLRALHTLAYSTASLSLYFSSNALSGVEFPW